MTDAPDPRSNRPDKMLILSKALDAGPAIIHINPRATGVQVPDLISNLPAISLNLSRDFEPRDLLVTDILVSETLDFGGEIGKFHCFIPSSAIFMVDGQDQSARYFFADCCPAEVTATLFKKAETYQDMAARFGMCIDSAIGIINSGLPRTALLHWRNEASKLIGKTKPMDQIIVSPAARIDLSRDYTQKTT